MPVRHSQCMCEMLQLYICYYEHPWEILALETWKFTHALIAYFNFIFAIRELLICRMG